MITAVDTSVLLDVFGADPRHGAGSATALRRCLNEGAIVACCVVWAETRAAFAAEESFVSVMRALGIGFSAHDERATALGGANWKTYRAAGGKRDRVMADFLIGAHAIVQCDRLLTRDRGYYRTYFEGLLLVDMSK